MSGPILVVNSEHPKLAEEKAKQIAERFTPLLEEGFGISCETCHFTELSLDGALEGKHSGVMLSGCGTDWSEYPRKLLKGAHAFLRNVFVPVLAVCGGHQMLAMAHGAHLGPMRKLKDGEEDPWPSYHPGMFKEAGYLAVMRLKEDPLLEGLPDEFVVKQSHYFQVLELPMGFELLAWSRECRIQAMRKLGTHVYGVQFHPEMHDEEHPDGRRVIENFLKMCRAKG